MKRIFCTLFALLMLMSCCAAGAELQRSEYLDKALSMLEEGNPFVKRYNEITESNVQPLFPQGIPYFFGGQNQVPIFAKYPEYTTRKAWLGDGWQIKDQNYIYGFDCYGFINWIWGEANGDDLDNIESLMKEAMHHGEHLWCSEIDPFVPYWDTLAQHLQPGDLFAMNHGAKHVAMFIGTLRDFGYTAEDHPNLAPWLDYPLMIHSQYFHPAFEDRFKELIRYGLPKYRGCKPTQGGVTVSLIGVPLEEVQHHVTKRVNDTDLDAWYFDIGYEEILTVINTEDMRQWCWYREP